MGQLDGKVAVITGSSRGLGAAIAAVYAREGAAVVLSARSVDQLNRTVQALTTQGRKAAGFACDVGDPAQVEALADFAVQTFGKIDIWVNNAGVSGIYGPTASIPRANFERVVSTNILGTYYGSVAALDRFATQGSGKLINLLGRGDDKPVAYQNAYAPSKAWVRSFTLALAQEYKDQGIGIYAFNPGLVDTDMLRKLEAVPGYEAKLNPLRTVIQMWGNEPEVPAEKALWLASAATDGKTGLAVSVLTRRLILGGVLKLLRSKITRHPLPDVPLDITTVSPKGRQGQSARV